MCGIVARFSKGYAKPFHIVSQLDQIHHRGPDARGAFGWNDDDTSFSRLDETEIGHKCHIIGHVRLAIIDLSDAAVQPFVSTDGRFVLSYNGEIYNYVELRQQLLARGIRFRTESDTEVLLHAWDTWANDVATCEMACSRSSYSTATRTKYSFAGIRSVSNRCSL
jgi:asparagine synthase (glutamine-hydrolysing)